MRNLIFVISIFLYSAAANPPSDAESEAELSRGRKQSVTFINSEAIKIRDAIRQGRTAG